MSVVLSKVPLNIKTKEMWCDMSVLITYFEFGIYFWVCDDMSNCTNCVPFNRRCFIYGMNQAMSKHQTHKSLNNFAFIKVKDISHKANYLLVIFHFEKIFLKWFFRSFGSSFKFKTILLKFLLKTSANKTFDRIGIYS